MLFQFGALFTDLTVFENVAFPLREHTGLPESMVRDLVLMKLSAVGLRGAAGPAHRRSLRRHGAPGRARARRRWRPRRVIMYDEPFAGLDPISMGVTANLIRQLNDTTGATSIVVSHDVREYFEHLPTTRYHDGARRAAVVAARPAGGTERVDRSGSAPVHPRRAGRPGQVPLSGRAARAGSRGGVLERWGPLKHHPGARAARRGAQ